MTAWRELAGGDMTRRDREDLLKLARLQERVARTSAEQRSAELLADFEQQLSSIYSYDQDAVWRKLAEEAIAAVNEADQRIAERCRELGIPARFRPGLNVSWYGRGENALHSRRTELRATARTRIAALEKDAKAKIQQRSVEVQTALMAGGLQTAEARAFVQSMPTAAELMPPLDVRALEAATGRNRGETPELEDTLADYEVDAVLHADD